MDIKLSKTLEQQHWDLERERQGANIKPSDLTISATQQRMLTPCFDGPGDHYSENRASFHQLIKSRGGWTDKVVLDYACGLGLWSIYFAQTGARVSHGFDLSEVGLKQGRQAAKQAEVGDKVILEQMDATNLTYPAEFFDIVIGHGVLHHTIKYPGIFDNLHRVMKSGTSAYFLENLADFPLWRAWWALKGEVPDGDVPIFRLEIERLTHMFSEREIIGETFVHSLKSLLYRKEMPAWRRAFLRRTHSIDSFLFRRFPSLRNWGSMSLIVLKK